jgi:hypothetical protein
LASRATPDIIPSVGRPERDAEKVMKKTTNAALAQFHQSRANHFQALADRDAGLPVTEGNADYLAATMPKPDPVIASIEPVEDLSFMDEVQAVAALPAKAMPAAKPAIKPAAEAVESNGRSGPTGRQLRVLALLARSKAPLNKAAIMAGASIGAGWVNEIVGHPDADKRAHHDGKWGITLVTFGFTKVKRVTVEEGMKPETVWEITAAGRKALVKAEKDAG